MTLTHSTRPQVTAGDEAARAALRLQTWLSPAFPIGGFSYSHGLEFAVEAGLVCDADTAERWAHTVVEHGSGRGDAILLAHAYRALELRERCRFVEIAELAAALRPTAELALESTAQGRAFLVAAQGAWPLDEVARAVDRLEAASIAPALPVAVAIVARAHGIPLETVLLLALGTFTAGIVSAAVRLVPLGQREALRVIAALEEPIVETSRRALTAPLDEVGSATPALDWCSMQHETQRTRLFRS